MPTEKLSFIIDAENKARAAIDQVKSQLDTVQDKVKNMKPAFEKMAMVGTAGFAAITGAVVLCVKAAAESETQWARVAHQIKLAGLDFESTMSEAQRFASEIQRLTGYSDEYIGMLVGRFLPSVKNLEEAKRMARIALDMEASGMVTAETAAKALMAAHEGDIMMLRRYVPELRGLDSEMLENMSTTERYELAMAALEGQFGGLAEAAGKTTAGQLRVLKETFGDLQEKIGEQFIPIIVSLVEKIMPVIEKVMKWIEENPKLTMVIIVATGAVFGLVAILGTLGLVLPGIITMFGTLSAVSLPITGIILAIIAVIGILIYIGYELWRNWDTVISNMKLLWEQFVNALIESKRGIEDILKKIRDIFESVFKWIREKVMDPFISTIDRLISRLQRALSFMSDIGGAVGGAVGRVMGGGQFGIPTVPRTGMYMLHRGETVSPAGAGSSIVVNITGGYFLSETVAEEIGDTIISKLKRTMKI